MTKLERVLTISCIIIIVICAIVLWLRLRNLGAETEAEYNGMIKQIVLFSDNEYAEAGSDDVQSDISKSLDTSDATEGKA